jgi:hypothetical protein
MQRQSFAAAADNIAQLLLQCSRTGRRICGTALQPRQFGCGRDGLDLLASVGKAAGGIRQFENHVAYAPSFGVIERLTADDGEKLIEATAPAPEFAIQQLIRQGVELLADPGA